MNFRRTKEVNEEMNGEANGEVEVEWKRPAVELADELLGRADELDRCVESRLAGVLGREKLWRRLRSERRFLETVRKKATSTAASTTGCASQQLDNALDEMLRTQLRSSNLHYLSALIQTAAGLVPSCPVSDVRSVLKSTKAPFLDEEMINSNDEYWRPAESELVVDIECDGGKRWIKVVARNPEALHLAWAGHGQFGHCSLTRQADLYQLHAKHNLCLYSAPVIHFHFSQGLTQPLRNWLTSRAICCSGDLVQVSMHNLALLAATVDDNDNDDDDDQSNGNDEEAGDELGLAGAGVDELVQPPGDLVFNLDVSTLMVLCSNMTHGNGSCQQFAQPILRQQAAAERQCPVLPALRQLLAGHRCLVCRSALEDFRSILSTVGSRSEIERADRVLSDVEVVDDSPSERALRLRLTARLKERARTVFGTGDRLRAVTVSANQSFVHAAASQGVKFAVHLHESRALSGQKELTGRTAAISDR